MRGYLQKRTLVSRVVNEIRELVLSGELEPGDYLPSRKELASRFGVGMSTIHEAVQSLSAVGLVEACPGKGTWVRNDALETLIHPAAVETRLGEVDARQICEARFVIEVALTEMAAQRATPEDIDRIMKALDSMESLLEDDDAFVQADVEFHVAVAKAGHNDLLEQLYHLSRRMLSATISELVRLPGVKEEAMVVQRAIAQAIQQHDSRRARQAAEAHMAIIEQLLKAAGL